MKFEAAALDAVGGEAVEGAQWRWDFGDGTTSASNPAEHGWDKPGKYKVTATANLAGSRASESVTVNVVQQLDGEFTLELDPDPGAGPVADRWGLKLTGPGSEQYQQVGITHTWHLCSLYDDWVESSHIGPWTLEEAGLHRRVWRANWTTWPCRNFPAATKVEVHWVGWGPPPPPNGDAESNTVTATPQNTIIKADPLQGIIKYDPESEDPTIDWTITHLDPTSDGTPVFDVHVQICRLGGDMVHDVTVEQTGEGPGQYRWDGTCDGPPEYEAAKGIYTFRLVARHRDHPPCTDHDKSSVLEIGVDNFYYLGKDPVNGKVVVQVKYTLSTDAGSVFIKFLGSDFSELGQLTGQETAKGTNLSDVYEMSAPYDPPGDANGELVTPLYCVVYAEESGEDAGNNRDHQPKPALQKGVNAPTRLPLTVSPSGKVIISTKHDDEYPLAQQTEDRKVEVTVSISDTDYVGETIHLKPFDPPDMSSYTYDAEDPEWSGDNNGGPGTLSDTEKVAALENESAVVRTTLTISDQHAGGNYVVAAAPRVEPTLACAKELFNNGGDGHLLVAWKRVYIEEDKMYCQGYCTHLRENPRADGDPSRVKVSDPSIFWEFDEVVVFDAEKPSPEEGAEVRTVWQVVGDYVYLGGDLNKTYEAGYPYPWYKLNPEDPPRRNSGDGAAIVLRDAQSGGFVYDADLESRRHQAYGGDFRGEDGGCFSELKRLSAGEDYVPFVDLLLDGNRNRAFAKEWFDNYRNAHNYVYLLGAHGLFPLTDGWSSEQYNYSSVAVPECPGAENPNAVVHELGHQFDLGSTDDNHPDVPCHMGAGTDLCVMDYDSDDDEWSEFCYDGPCHLMAVRSYGDPL